MLRSLVGSEMCIRDRRQELECKIDGLNGFDEATQRLGVVMNALRADGSISGWRDEQYGVHPLSGGEALCSVERASAIPLGIPQLSLIHI
eukprot:TRINITY_DN19264_c0_g1_i2.p1 TRINITY_DN19264_c0_g1~~TRINITY_DN19264_c0_g1_i2.p1  ORF type:complete len:101 (+),score=43.85 TRINITY_DN19264_c0_g1_i2:36-305(+)